jgi:hypothetical protein
VKISQNFENIWTLIFAYILQGKMGKMERTKNHTTSDQNTKNQTTKIWDEQTYLSKLAYLNNVMAVIK